MGAALFYILAVVMVVATLLAITGRHPVHAIVYLVTSFFALAGIFYLLLAPLVAMFEVIIYAGAVMVLFMFVIMMLDLGHPEKADRPGLRQWLPALVLCAVILGSLLLAAMGPAATARAGGLGVKEFATTLFGRYGVAIEVISLQLLFAVVGALYLGRRRGGEGGQRPGEGDLP
jgi:NADH-quinone oxidoreductase subunit J